MTDVSISVTAIQSWISNVQSAFAQVSDQIAKSGPGASFADVFSSVQSMLDAGPGGGATASALAPASAITAGQQALLTSAIQQGSSTTSGSAVVSTATSFLGTPYLWGGTTPAGFDCSGFVQYVYGQLGVSLPRTSEAQATAGAAVPSLAQAEPGDLVFYAGSDGTASSPGHVGIYIGNGQMIDAPQTGESVSVQPVGDPVAIRRVLAGAPASFPVATTGAPSVSSTSPAGVPEQLLPLFQQAASQYNVPLSLLTSVANVESGFNPNAVSSTGAQGLMQLMPATAAGLGVNPLDPAQAIDGAAQLLSKYLAQYQSTPLALAAYNAGPAAVAQYGGVPPFPETEAYVQSVMSTMGASA